MTKRVDYTVSRPESRFVIVSECGDYAIYPKGSDRMIDRYGTLLEAEQALAEHDQPILDEDVESRYSGGPGSLIDETYNDPAEYDPYDESMDGDFDSAMASAGMGTDEDYGYYGGDE